MKLKITICILSLGLLIGCGKQEETNKSVLELQKEQAGQVQEIVQSVSHLDSINKLRAEINELKNTQLSKQQQIAILTKKKDSVTSLLNQVQLSLDQVNAKKIAPGIEGVNTKLAELKGQRENAQEQLELQKLEIVLAEKKIGLLNEEKTVYDAQFKALYAKGAAPADFIDVNKLLAGLNGKISEQVLRVKSLKSTIADVTDQIASIDAQRSSLSDKIRNNYTAKEIFDDYSKEEKTRLEAQLKTINDELTLISSDDASISNLIATQNSKKSSFENEQSSAEEIALLNEQKKNMEANALLAKNNQDAKSKQKKSKKSFALILVSSLAAILLLFFFLGKMRKSKIKQNK